MAKNLSKGRKRLLSLIFHLVVLTVMVSAYDTARALMKSGEPEQTEAEKKEQAKQDKKISTNELADKKEAIKSTATSTGKKIGNKLSETKQKMEERGTSMEDLMAEKERRAKAKAAQLKEQEKPGE